MGSVVVAGLLFILALYSIYAWLRGERDIFEDGLAFGAVLLLVGVIGGAFFGLTIARFLESHQWIPPHNWVGVLVCLAIWALWFTMVFRFLTSQSEQNK